MLSKSEVVEKLKEVLYLKSEHPVIHGALFYLQEPEKEVMKEIKCDTCKFNEKCHPQKQAYGCMDYTPKPPAPESKPTMVDLDYNCTLAKFAEQIGIKLWQAMAMMKYKTPPPQPDDYLKQKEQQ